MKRRHCSSGFTLVEVVSALFVITIVALITVRAFANLQRIWLRSERRQTVFDNARIAFDLITTDLEGMIVSDFPGEEMRVDATGDAGLALAFVSATCDDGVSAADVYEVGYRYNSEQRTLERWTTGSTDGAAWDFLGRLPETWAITWGDSEVIAAGVTEATFNAYRSDAEEPGGWVPYSAVTDSLTRPGLVTVSLTVVPPSPASLPPAVLARHQRRFTKTVYIGN